MAIKVMGYLKSIIAEGNAFRINGNKGVAGCFSLN